MKRMIALIVVFLVTAPGAFAMSEECEPFLLTSSVTNSFATIFSPARLNGLHLPQPDERSRHLLVRLATTYLQRYDRLSPIEPVDGFLNAALHAALRLLLTGDPFQEKMTHIFGHLWLLRQPATGNIALNRSFTKIVKRAPYLFREQDVIEFNGYRQPTDVATLLWETQVWLSMVNSIVRYHEHPEFDQLYRRMFARMAYRTKLEALRAWLDGEKFDSDGAPVLPHGIQWQQLLTDSESDCYFLDQKIRDLLLQVVANGPLTPR